MFDILLLPLCKIIINDYLTMMFSWLFLLENITNDNLTTNKCLMFLLLLLLENITNDYLTINKCFDVVIDVLSFFHYKRSKRSQTNH